jgi:hypothetical protein
MLWRRRPLREEPLYRLPKRILVDSQLYFIAALILLALPFVVLRWTLQLVAWFKEHIPEPVAITAVIAGLVFLPVNPRRSSRR